MSFAPSILSKTERKDLKFFHFLPIFIEIGKVLAHLADYENTQGEISQQEIKIAFFILLGP